MTGLHWTEEELAAHFAKRPLYRPLQDLPLAAAAPEPSTLEDRVPVGPKFRSKAEVRYADLLERRRLAGEIADWDYEALTLVVGRAGRKVTRLTPDFVVETLDRTIELHEVKGTYIREDARAKLLSAVRQWPGFVWRLAVWDNGRFSMERL